MDSATLRTLGGIALKPSTPAEWVARLSDDFAHHRAQARAAIGRLAGAPSIPDLLIWASNARLAADAAARRKREGGPRMVAEPDVDFTPGRNGEGEYSAAGWLCTELTKRSGFSMTLETLHDLATIAMEGRFVAGRADLRKSYAQFVRATHAIKVSDLLDGLNEAFPIVASNLPLPGHWSVPMTKDRVSRILHCDSRQIHALHPGVMRKATRQRFRIRLDKLDAVMVKRYEGWLAREEAKSTACMGV